MLRILILVIYLRLFSATDVTSYARVSRNGQLARSSHDSLSWIARPPAKNNTSANENRSINDLVIAASPVYVSPKTPKLKKGEAIDHPVAPRYSTLDHEMIAKLDASRKQIQQRFTPYATFDTGNGKPQKGASAPVSTSSSNMNSSSFPGPIFSGMYEYSPPDFLDRPPQTGKPASKPIISIGKYPPVDTDDKMPDSYKPSASNYHAGDDHETDYPSFDVPPSYENDAPVSKPMKYAGHRPYPIVEDPYDHDHHVFHHDVIYDHVPEYHEHHHEHTTEEPEMNDQRLDKRPYSYYFIGKKLWYIPLYFSIYFIIYIAALVLKSIARHKINLPSHLAEAAAGHSRRSEQDDGWWHFAGRILEGVERFAETSNKSS